MADDLIPEAADAVGTNAGVAAGPRARRFLRLFLMVAGGLAAPCLALAAFFLTGSGGGDGPAAKSASIAGGRVTATTRAAGPSSTTPPHATAPSTSTTTTTAPVPARPSRDPFVPLVSQNSASAPKG
jgi:hypothetical protein